MLLMVFKGVDGDPRWIPEHFEGDIVPSKSGVNERKRSIRQGIPVTRMIVYVVTIPPKTHKF